MVAIIRLRIFCLPVCYLKIQILRRTEKQLRDERRLRAAEKRVLRRIFGPNRDEVPVEWRKLHNEELNDPFSSPIIIRVIKSRRTRWAGNVARMWKGEAYTGFWWGNLRL
jgi:hypothetical protein